MTLAFVDTGAWIALMVPRDGHHRQAREFFRDVATVARLLTSNYVLAETVTWLAYHGLRHRAVQLREMVTAAAAMRRLEIVWATPEIDAEAWDYYQRLDSRELSFCDCASFAISHSRSVDYVFGFDTDFRIAGLELRP